MFPRKDDGSAFSREEVVQMTIDAHKRITDARRELTDALHKAHNLITPGVSSAPKRDDVQGTLDYLALMVGRYHVEQRTR